MSFSNLPPLFQIACAVFCLGAPVLLCSHMVLMRRLSASQQWRLWELLETRRREVRRRNVLFAVSILVSCGALYNQSGFFVLAFALSWIQLGTLLFHFLDTSWLAQRASPPMRRVVKLRRVQTLLCAGCYILVVLQLWLEGSSLLLSAAIA